MNVLPILLILGSLVFLVLGALHIYEIVDYNRRLRRQRSRAKSQLGRRSQPKQLDLMAVFLFLTALLLLLLALLLIKHQKPVEQPTEPPTESSHVQETEAPTTAPTEKPEPPAEDNWKEENGTYYYLLEDGTKATGWQDINGSRYYFQKDGAMTVGWAELDKSTYYFQADGKMATGTVEIDGTKRYFAADGKEILLVNPWNPVPEGQEPELIALSSDYGSDGCQVDKTCLNDLISMLEACNSAAPKAYVVSGYRSYDYQERLFQRKVNSYLSEGYTQEEAEQEAATVVALPGTSEHQLGLAVDIIDTSLWDLVEEQENLPAQKWLMEHSWEYGFIFRYPKDKTDATGIIYEPWHYRYVGKELAQAIHYTGLTLEEYIATLG